MSKNVSDQLVEVIEQAGIKRIYAVTGDSLNYINDAVRRNGNLQWIHVRHEEVGAFAAGAEAQLNGMACCAGSCGPGHVHLINGVYDAHRSSASVLVIASLINTNEIGVSYFQGTNTIKLFDDCSGYNQVATTPTQVSRMLQSALQHSYHRNEVAVLGIPGDICKEDAVECPTTLNLIKTKSIYTPDLESIKALADLLNSTEKITLFCGIGAQNSHDEFVMLSQKINAPVAYTFKGKMSTQYDNPNEVGMTGLLGTTSGYQAVQEAELLLMLGTDFPYESFIPDGIKIVQIDEKPERLGRRAQLTMGLAGDIKDTLSLLLPLINQKTKTDFLQKHLDNHKDALQKLEAEANDKGTLNNISPEYLSNTINKLANDDAIFTLDTGMSCTWGARYINATGKRKFLGSFNHGSMANAMPQAIGAQLARPNNQVIALCGDGGLSMLLGDLSTITQYKLPIKLIVFNNRSLGMVKLEMQVQGLPDWQTDLQNPVFDKVADAMGIKGMEVRNPDDLENTLKEAFAFNGPVLVNVYTNPNSLAMPPQITLEQVKGFAKSMGKMLIDGRVDEIENIVKTNLKYVKNIF